MSAPVDVAAVIGAVLGTLGRRTGAVALHEPEFRGNEIEYVTECIRSGWVSSAGAFVDRFESMLAEYTGASHVSACVNGTAALQVCLRLAGVQPGDEVLTPTLTFIATANAISYCHAFPHFVDSEMQSLGVDARKLESYLHDIAELRGSTCVNRRTGRRIAAVVVMHTFGHPADLDALLAVCDRFGLPLVEDAAESLGSLYKEKHTGRFGRVAALSFNGNKLVTTGGGGAILTDDPKLGPLAKHLTTTARLAHRWSFIHDTVGYNYRMPNLNAALGVAQLERLADSVVRKRRLADRYAAAFRSVAGVSFVTEPPATRSNYWLNAILLDEPDCALRDTVIGAMHERGLLVRPVWTLMHRLPMYRACERMPLEVAESIDARLINLPSSAFLVDALG